jgi:hypothetical protein
VAAVRTGRHYVGYDTDPSYVAAARARVAGEVEAPASPTDRLVDVASALITAAGCTDLVVGKKPVRAAPTEVDLAATGPDGRRRWFLLGGGFSTGPTGLRRGEVLWRVIGQAALLRAVDPAVPVVAITTALPVKGTPLFGALRAAIGPVLSGVVDASAPDASATLAAILAGPPPPG